MLVNTGPCLKHSPIIAFRFEVEVKFSIPNIIVEPTLDVAQTAIADVAKGILDANKSKWVFIIPLRKKFEMVYLELSCIWLVGLFM